MKEEERAELQKELEEIEIRLKAPFINPRDFRRKEEIVSLLISDGEHSNLNFKIKGKFKKSKRVTSFTRDRR